MHKEHLLFLHLHDANSKVNSGVGNWSIIIVYILAIIVIDGITEVNEETFCFQTKSMKLHINNLNLSSLGVVDSKSPST